MILLRISITLALLPLILQAEVARIAVASNFSGASKTLSESFHLQFEHKLKLSYASTAKLYAQIKQGAPFDAFLAADSKHPQLLLKDNIVESTPFTYAMGKLALWSAKKIHIGSDLNILENGTYNRLAIANPRLAPYGAASKEVLIKLNLWEENQNKLVRGENIAQTFQFIYSENADLGFIAYSQLKASKQNGSHYLIPQSYHSAIIQDAVLITDNPAAADFLKFMKSPEGIKIIINSGYEVE